MIGWNELHARIMGEATQAVVGKPDMGTMAFVRCLTPEVVESLANDKAFAPSGWTVWRVANIEEENSRTITADRAVELRESKGTAVLLLVDTIRAGAGMDGIYSAAQEVDETSLFTQALRLAREEVKHSFSPRIRDYAETAVKKARRFGHRFQISPWTEFDFLTRIAAEKRHPGELLYLVGLWPVKPNDAAPTADSLDMAQSFVERLLGTAVAGLTPAQRIETLKLLNPSPEQITDLERFLWTAATMPLFAALAELVDKPHLWINALKVERAAQTIQSIELVPWRTKMERIAKWSGLIDGADADDPPLFILDPEADKTANYSRLEVHWRARPDNLEKSTVEYRVTIVTDMEEELASREIAHTGKREEKCRFTNDDFSMLSDDALIGAKVIVSVNGNHEVEEQESEEFTIRFGRPPEHEPAGVGKKVRTFSEGLIELEERTSVSDLASATQSWPVDSKGFVLLRAPQRGKSFRVFCPPLIREVEKRWGEQSGNIGRWRVRVRASGMRVTEPEFVPLSAPASPAKQTLWNRVSNASRRMADRFSTFSGVGQIYDEKSSLPDTFKKRLKM